MEMNAPMARHFFETSDFWLAGALIASGKKLTTITWRGKRAFFIFDDSIGCQAASEAYFREDLIVKAKRFSDALRTLKDRLFNHDLT